MLLEREDENRGTRNEKKGRKSTKNNTNRALNLLLVLLICLVLIKNASCRYQDEDENGDEESKRESKERQQRKKEARIIRKILSASTNGDHYKVLGLKNVELKVPFKIPRRVEPMYIRFFHPNESDIKKAYRQRARFVHPDKNSNSQAYEAFHALDESAAILLDEKLRTEYDSALREIRERIRQERISFVKGVFGMIYGVSSKVTGMGRKFLGPFMTPVIVLGALII